MMFEELAAYKFILVTGPQRSGTTIAARMIAEDTGKEFIPEAAMATENKNYEARNALRTLLGKFMKEDRSTVVQCPIQCRYIHELERAYITVSLIVMMMREVPDIIASEERIGWDAARQRALYSDVMPDIATRFPICVVKYMFWNMAQRPHILDNDGNVLELDYSSLCHHSMWLPKEQRVNFGPRQVSHAEDYATMKLEVLV